MFINAYISSLNMHDAYILIAIRKTGLLLAVQIMIIIIDAEDGEKL